VGSPSTREASEAILISAVSNVCPRIRTANVLLISIRALANEVAKNLVLAGIASITLADHEVVTEDDLGAQFLITEADIGKNVSYSQLYNLLLF
jgi:molybdopterin/thiamine biosynthesis adenylyltransferase